MDCNERHRVRNISQISDDSKVISLSDEELIALEFLGPDAAQEVIDFIAAIKKVPQHFDWLTVFQLGCLNTQVKYHPGAPSSPSPPTANETTLLSQESESTAADNDSVPPFERVYFYHGVSYDPPHLLQRSDLKQRPYVIPRERHSAIPVKTAQTANHPILKNAFWKGSVAPEIIALLEEESRGVHVSSMLPVRFSTANEDGPDVYDDHIVLWISVHPNTTTETSCRLANDPILAILAKHGIDDAAVHWIEGAVEPLTGPPMMRVARDTDQTHYVRRALTALLSVHIAAEELADDDAQGSIGIFFHEGKDHQGKKSKRVMATTNKHVVSKNIKVDYQFSGRRGAHKQYIRNCSLRRFQQVFDETRALLTTSLGDAKQFAEQLEELLANPPEDEEEADHKRDVARKKAELKKAEEDVGTLNDFYKLLGPTWSDAYQRIIGYLDWAPAIANDADPRRYTRDIGVIALDDNKFSKNFEGNFVYLAGKFTRDEIVACFHPNAANPPVFEYPENHQFRLLGYVDAAGLSNPYFLDEDNKSCSIVAKDGLKTDLTFGRQSELEAYTCSNLAGKSWEVAVLNYGGKKHGNFSGKGDSGAAIFNAEGKFVAILHSGMPRGMSNHVTYGTPAHYVVDLIRAHYPDADFSRMKYGDDATTAA